MKPFALIVVIALAVAASAQSIDECLQKDSISCVQMSLYRKAREFFDKDNLEIVGGVSLVKAAEGSARSGKSLALEQEIDQAGSVADRQSALENFVGQEVGDFFSGRSLRINFSPALEKIGESARAISESIPIELKQAADEVAEGRGKKKLMKKLMPLLLVAKAKIGILATFAYFALALIAKKAIIASLLSIAITSFFGLKGLWDKKGSGIGSFPGFGGHGTTGYNAGGWSSAGSNGWSSGGGGGSASGWDDGHNYAAQSQAFSGYH